jgi:hypothetical protein
MEIQFANISFMPWVYFMNVHITTYWKTTGSEHLEIVKNKWLKKCFEEEVLSRSFCDKGEENLELLFILVFTWLWHFTCGYNGKRQD